MSGAPLHRGRGGGKGRSNLVRRRSHRLRDSRGRRSGAGLRARLVLRPELLGGPARAVLPDTSGGRARPCRTWQVRTIQLEAPDRFNALLTDAVDTLPR